MRKARSILILAVLALSALSASGQKARTTVDPSAIEARILELVNQERKRSRIQLLEADDGLAKVARDYSVRMARRGFFGHYDPSGNSVAERASDADIDWSRIGENLFFCGVFDDIAGEAVKRWLASPGHRKNMLERSFSRTGIGVARSRRGEYYITQVFITP